MTQSTPLGRFVWFDLMTRDPDAAIAFYKATCGWGTESWQTEGNPPYVMWTTPAGAMGGTMQLPPNVQAPPHWLGYVSTPDIAATAARAQGLGATVLRPPTPIPSVGAFAVLTDPQGAMFALFTPEGDAQRPEGPAGIGEFSWFELATSDHRAAFDFYGALFGWTKGDAIDMGPAGTYQLFERAGQRMGGMYNITAQMPMPPSWCFYTRVESVDAASARCTANGGKVLFGPMEVPGGDRVAMCLDPQGAMFALQEAKG